MKTIFLFVLFTINAFAAADVSDCKPEDQCKYDDCVASVVEELDNKAMATCREVYKLKDGKHQLAYKEIKLLIQKYENKKSVMMGNTIRLP